MEGDFPVESDITGRLAIKFPLLEGKLQITRERRIFADVPSDIFQDVIGFLKNEMGFDHICTITGLDVGEELQFIYHISDKHGIVMNLKLNVPKADPVAGTITPLFNGAVFYERELESMLGAKIKGLPDGRRYPLFDGWPEGQYPLRKDWKPEMLTEALAQKEQAKKQAEGGRS